MFDWGIIGLREVAAECLHLSLLFLLAEHAHSTGRLDLSCLFGVSIQKTQGSWPPAAAELVRGKPGALP